MKSKGIWICTTAVWGMFCVIFAQSTIIGFWHNGYWRTSRVYVPQGCIQPMPLVLNLHGYGANALQQEAYTQMDMVADTGCFIVAYPNGINNSWEISPSLSIVDDVGFIERLVDTISALFPVDTSRVFVCGLSMGGAMTLKLVIFLRNRIKAAAVVAPPLLDTTLQALSLIFPLPLLHIHGTADGIVPYNGTAYWLPVDTFITKLATSWSCSGYPGTDTLPDTYPSDGSIIVHRYWCNCGGPPSVHLYRVENGGHTWPGAQDIATLGNTNHDINASAEIWQFFSGMNTCSTAAAPPYFNGQSIDCFYPFAIYPEGKISLKGKEDVKVIKKCSPFKMILFE